MRGYNFKYNILYDSEILEYKPTEVYLEVDYNHSIIIPKKNDYIYKGAIIAHNKGEIKNYTYSPISGNIIDIVDKTNEEGNIIKCLNIENDYKENSKERKGIKENIYDYDKNSFIELLRESGIKKDNNPIYLDYAISNINYLVINAYECLPYVKQNSCILFIYIKEILKTIDALIEINKINKCYLVVNANDKLLIKKIESYIATYINIKLIKMNINYPFDNNEYIIKKIINIDYNNNPSSKGIVINDVNNIYNIYHLLKHKKTFNYNFLYVDGDIIKPKLLKIKKGTPIVELINLLHIKDNSIFIANNPLNGPIIDIDNTVVTDNLNNLIILEKNKEISSNCINCGKCIKYCPYNIYPLNSKNISKCTECGLCNYICPSKIDLCNKIKEFLNELSQE